MRARMITATAIVLAMLGAALGAVAGNASAATGTPDSYGYVYTDSKTPEPSVSFNWVDITGTGTRAPLSGDDTYGGPYPIGFNFSFYGQRFTMFNISTNGFITFGPCSSSLSNTQLPNAGTPNNLIAAYWDDMVVGTDELIYQIIGSEPNRQFVLEWYNVNRYGYSSYPMTFEIILNETTGDIWLQYLSLSTYPFEGQSATVGIENADGTIGTQYCYNQYVLEDGLAIRFSTMPVIIGPSQADQGEPGETVTYDITVGNLQPFSDCIDVTYASVEGWTVSMYDVLMNPLTDTDTDGIPDTGTLLAYESFDMFVTVEIPPVIGAAYDETTLYATSTVDPLVGNSCVLTTSLQIAWLEPPHSDYGVDEDLDGLYDELAVEVSVYAMNSGWCYLEGHLQTGSFASIAWDYTSYYLTTGTNSIELSYYGWSVRDTASDGPYVVELYLYDDSYVLIGQGTHDTFAYSYTDFAEDPGLFAPPFSDEAPDEDSDGLYDYLQVDVNIEVNRAGRFIVSGGLYDDSWLWLEDFELDDDFDVGVHTLSFVFDPWTIRTQAIGGQFNIEVYLEADIDGWLMWMDYEWYETSYYDAMLFEAPPAMFEPPHSDYGVDDDADLLWDRLVVEVSVNVTEAGIFTVQGVLTDMWGTYMETVSEYGYLDVGVQIVELEFLGFWMRFYGNDGPYNVYLYLKGESLMMDEDYHQTSYYAYNSFEDALAWFEPPHSSYALDSDGDMLNDSLVFEVRVNATVADAYWIVAYLYEPGWGSYLGEDLVEVHLDVGVNIVEMTFAGWQISNSWEEGNFIGEFYLYGPGDRYLDYDLFSTDYYYYTDFDEFPAEITNPVTSYAADDDHDMLYDRLQVNTTVEVYSEGQFYLRGILYDNSWWQVSFDDVWATLEEGTQLVTLDFPGWMIYAHGYDTTLWVELHLYDSEMNQLSSWTHMAAWYDHDEFETGWPMMQSGWTESTPAIDGLVGDGEWSDATAVELAELYAGNEVPATLMVMNDASTLYICYDAYGDMSENRNDASSVSFDTDNTRLETDGADDQFWMTAESLGSTGHLVFDDNSWSWEEDCSPFRHEGLSGAIGFAVSPDHDIEHRIFEYAIPLSLLGVAAGNSMGFLGGSEVCPGVDDDGGEASWWPAHTDGFADMNLYGELTLAAPVVIPPPTTTAVAAGTAGTSGWFTSGVNVTLSATGGDGGVDYTEYRVNGGAWTAYSSPVVFNADGTHTLEYRSVDNAAQVEATKTLTVKIDRVAPVTVATVSSPNVWLNMTDATSGAGHVTYRIDGGAWMTYSGMLTLSEEGTHTVEYYSVDAAGNAEAAQTLEVEVGDDGGAFGFGDWTFWMVIALIAIIAIISIGAIFGMRRKAKESDAKSAIKDIGTAVSQMQEDVTPPQTQEPPKPPEGK